MPTLKTFALPDLGEGLTEGEILSWLVKAGDTITLNQPIVEVETAKAAVEIPSPYAGEVRQLHHDAGETVDVGSVIITIDTDPGGAASSDGAGAAPEADAATADMLPSEPGLTGSPAPKAATEEKISVLVGTGPKAGKTTRRPRKAAAAATGSAGASSGGSAAAAPVETSAAEPTPAEEEQPAAYQPPARVSGAAVAAAAEQAATAGTATVHVLAKPPVRKLAKDLGVDLTSVTGTGPEGTVTRDDVERASSGAAASADVAASVGVPAARAGERIPIKGVRKMTAAAMVDSAFTAPHVTLFHTIDITPTMELVARLRTMRDYADVRVSPLLVVARALLVAIRRHPMINSSWDEAAQEIVVHGGVNLGIAAATPRGLIVPNIKGADSLALPDLARALDALVATARSGRTSPADMSGGTITITNVGVFGVDTGTPILNPGESAILAFGAVRDQPWVHEGQIAIRKVTQLSLSFDHRVVDGELGSRMMADLGALLSDPTLFAAWA